MDWIQCFSTYIAVVSHTEPEHVVDLVAYLNLIIKGPKHMGAFFVEGGDVVLSWDTSATGTTKCLP